MAGDSSYLKRVPTPGLTAFASCAWIQQVGDRPVAQRYVPHGGAEVRCVLGEVPQLLGPLTASTYRGEDREAYLVEPAHVIVPTFG